MIDKRRTGWRIDQGSSWKVVLRCRRKTGLVGRLLHNGPAPGNWACLGGGWQSSRDGSRRGKLRCAGNSRRWRGSNGTCRGQTNRQSASPSTAWPRESSSRRIFWNIPDLTGRRMNPSSLRSAASGKLVNLASAAGEALDSNSVGCADCTDYAAFLPVDSAMLTQILSQSQQIPCGQENSF